MHSPKRLQPPNPNSIAPYDQNGCTGPFCANQGLFCHPSFLPLPLRLAFRATRAANRIAM